MKLNDELKCRCSRATKQRLQREAKEAGKEFSLYVRELVETPHQAATVAGVLERLERLMAAVGPLLKPKAGEDLALVRLTRLEAIVEELAMHTSPQVMPRVAARLKTQSTERNVQ